MLLTPLPSPPGVAISLSNDILWEDEHNWVPVVATAEYSLTGALVVEPSLKQAGRSITLKSPGDGLGWVTRDVLLTLYAAASIPGKEFTLTLQYPSDTRSFTVMFDQTTNPVEAVPIKGFPQHASDDYFEVTLRFIEMPT